jgi:hypothetical protein
MIKHLSNFKRYIDILHTAYKATQKRKNGLKVAFDQWTRQLFDKQH